MQLMIELSDSETDAYLEIRQSLLQNPEPIMADFKGEWLRVVGKIGPASWLLAEKSDPLAKGDRDADNLKLAAAHGRPWDKIKFDRGYWVLDEKLADRVLAAGVRSYGIAFLHDYDIGQLSCKFQELWLGLIEHW